MARYALNPAHRSGTIPGIGKIRPGDVLEGQYDRYVPSVLMVLEDDREAEVEEVEADRTVSVIPTVELVTKEAVDDESTRKLTQVWTAAPDFKTIVEIEDEAVEELAALASNELNEPEETASVVTTDADESPEPTPRPVVQSKGKKKRNKDVLS